MSTSRVLNTSEGTMSASGKGDIMNTLGDIMKHVEGYHDYIIYHEYIGGYHEYMGVSIEI